MKKNLRLLCLGLAALSVTASFAQGENVTSKLRNADMEEGIRGWGVDGESNIFGKNTKSQASRPGFHGVTGGVLENWNGSGAGLADNSISQTVRELPAGTYVFGAYIAASLQGSEESNKDAVTGVTLFANESTVPVATDNPDKGGQMKWAHTAKFNVAATVAEGGNLQVGIKIENTTANYVVWDNATLYYFGNMSEDEALNEMAKIDMAATVAIADTCFTYKMNVDTLEVLTSAKTAAQAIATADQLWQLNEDLYWGIRLANRSIADYRSFNNAIEAAEVVAAGEWDNAVKNELAALNTAIVAAKATYEAATADRVALNEEKAALNEAAALVSLDSCYVVLDDELPTILEGLEADEKIGDAPGQYTEEKINQINDLMAEARAIVDEAYAYEVAAMQALHLYDSLYTAIQAILDNPNTVASFPISLPAGADGMIEGTVTEENIRYYESPLYAFDRPLERLRFTVLNNVAGNAFFTLSALELYDGEGNPIPLTADMISSNADHNALNPGSLDGDGIPALIDDEPTTYFHSAWANMPAEAHYLEVTLPEGAYSAFSFVMRGRQAANGYNQNHQFPAAIEITHPTAIISNLESAVSTAKMMNAFAGTDPGFYNADLSAFWNAIAAGEALLENGGTEDEMWKALTELETQQGLVDEMKVNLPAADKKYHLVIGYDGFYAKQGVQKAMYARGDSLVWWQTAGADSIGQEFVLESLGKLEDETPIYKVRNVHTNRYVVLDTENNHVALTADKAEADTVKLVSLGAGAFNLQATDGSAIHAGDHNSGSPSTSAGAYGGTYGIGSGLCFYSGGFNSASAWFVREMHALPYTAAVAGADYRSETFHLYSGVNTLNLTADKACAFTDLTVYDLWGNVIAADVNVSGNSATLMLDTLGIESFSLTFKNNEGVTSLVVNGNISKLSELQVAYDEAAAVAPEEGTGVMQYADLSAYKAAIAEAEKLLVSGGTDEQITAAIAALEKAVAELAPNMPDPDKTYFIVNALDAFEETHGVPMMLYATTDGTPRWMYENTDNQNRYWKFVPDTDVEEGAPAAYYLLNVGTGKYMGTVSGQSSPLAMVDEPDATTSYNIVPLEGTAVAIATATADGFRIHANGHGGGANKTGNIVYWNSGIGTASAWRIFESEAYITDIDFTEIEEGNDEYVAPVKKGIYDLFGRRIEAPAATGVYIVDGKKRVIKK